MEGLEHKVLNVGSTGAAHSALFRSLGVKRNNAMKLWVKTCHWNPMSQKDF